jgi:hypothetical protein
MLGVLGGPSGVAAAGLLSLALGIASSLLAAFEPQRKSLATEIKEELRHIRTQELHDELAAALADIERAFGPMKFVTPSSRTWEQMQSGWLNMFEGNAAHQLNLTRSWLSKTENQTQADWDIVFESYWQVTALRQQVFALMVTALQTTSDAQAIGGHALLDRKERDHEFARELATTAYNTGRLLHIGTGNSIYERTTFVSGNAYTPMPDGADRVLVGPVTKRLFSLDFGSGAVRVFDETKRSWATFKEPCGGAIDFWIMPEPSQQPGGRIGERVVVLKKSGDTIESKLSLGQAAAFAPSSRLHILGPGATGQTVKQVREFRSLYGADGTTYYFALGEKGRVYVSFRPPGDEPIKGEVTFKEIVDLGDDILGLSVGRDEMLKVDQLVAYGKKRVLRRRFAADVNWGMNEDGYPTDPVTNWVPMSLPQAASKNDIHFVAGSGTGEILALVDHKLHVYMPTSQRADGTFNWEWRAELEGKMYSVFAQPLPGFTTYGRILLG